MFPWLWFWAPQFHFPWSGNVAQRIDPDTHWFFGGIAPESGDARIEEKAFSVASYGRQLGLITEVLLDVTRQLPAAKTLGAEAQRSVARLTKIRDEIEQLKAQEFERTADTLAEQVRKIQREGGAKAKALNARLRPLLLEDAKAR